MISVLLVLAAQAPGQAVTTYWNTGPAQQAAPQATVQPAPVATIAQPAPLAVPPPVTGNAILRIGTEIPLRLEEALTTKGKQLRVGQRFHLTTSEPVLINGITVIPVGTPAEGEITDVRNKGMWGKSGHLAARILYMTVNGRQIRLSGTFDDKGTAGGWGAAAVSAFVFLPAGFLHDRHQRDGACRCNCKELRRRGCATGHAGRGSGADAGGAARDSDAGSGRSACSARAGDVRQGGGPGKAERA